MERINCPICGEDNVQILFLKGNVGNEIKPLTNVICNNCALVYINPRPASEEILKFQVAPGASGHHKSNTLEKAREKIESNDNKIKEKIADWLIKKCIPKANKDFKILDIGCGYGTLLNAIKEKTGLIGDGIELYKPDVEMAKNLFGFNLYYGSLQDFYIGNDGQYADGKKYDLIILHHTFEHFADPQSELFFIKGLLKPEGILYIAVPNILNMKKHPELFFQLGHPFSYSPASLNKMIKIHRQGIDWPMFKITDFNWNAAYPGGMECLARKNNSLVDEYKGSELEKGSNPAEVIAYVEKKKQEFGLWRSLRDKLLFFLPEKMRIAIGRKFYLILKNNKNIKQSIEKYWPLIAALGATIAFNWVHLVVYARHLWAGKSYWYYTFIGGDAMTNLAPMFRDIIDGHWFPSDGRIFEFRGLPNLWSLVDIWLATPFLLLTKSVPLTMLMGKLAVVFLATMVVYLLIKALTEQKKLAALFALVFFPAALFWNFLLPASVNSAPLIFNLKMVARTIFHLGSYPGEILLGKYDSLSNFPALFFFALALFFLYRALVKNNRKDILLAGALIGLNAYTFVTDFLYLGSALGVLLIVFALRREWPRVRLVTIIIATALITAVPYLANVMGVHQMPYGDELYRRLGGEITHAIRFSFWPRYLVYLLFAILVWYTAKQDKRELGGLFVGSLIATAIVVFNIQIVTGYNPSPPVWWLHQLYFAFGLGWAMLATALVNSIKRPILERVVRWSLTVVILSIFIRVITTNQYAASYTYPASLMPENIEKSLRWLDTNTPVDSVVGTPSLALNTLIPAFTHNNVYLPVAVTSPASLADITDRYFVMYKLYKVSPEYFLARLERQPISPDEYTYEHANALSTFMFDAYYYSTELDQSLDNRYRPIPKEVLEKLISDYKKYPSRLGYLINHHRLDYLYVSKYEREMMRENFDKIANFKKVYDEDGVTIYKINR